MKNLLYILLLSLFFISSCQETASLGCTEITAVNYSPLVDVDDGSCQYLEVGDYYQGGIIFYIDETGLSGFIASCNDLSDFQPWGCVGLSVFNSDNSAFGLGYSNSISITNNCSQSPNAAEQALSYEIDGYSDWFLPSADELYLVYEKIGQGSAIGNIANLASSAYWSSSEDGNNNAWSLSFGSGNWYNHPKGQYWRARPIRSF